MDSDLHNYLIVDDEMIYSFIQMKILHTKLLVFFIIEA